VYGRSQHSGSRGTLERGARYIEEPGYVSAAELCCMCFVLVASAEVAATIFLADAATGACGHTAEGPRPQCASLISVGRCLQKSLQALSGDRALGDGVQGWLVRRWGFEATQAEEVSCYARATEKFRRHDCGGRVWEDWEEPQRLPAESYGGFPRGRRRHKDAGGRQVRCGCACTELSPLSPTLTNNTSHESLGYVQVRCVLLYQICGRLDPS